MGIPAPGAIDCDIHFTLRGVHSLAPRLRRPRSDYMRNHAGITTDPRYAFRAQLSGNKNLTLMRADARASYGLE